MQKIGLIGGLGPESTVDYYNRIINAFKGELVSLDYPEIIIYSVRMAEFLKLMEQKEYDKVVEWMKERILHLKNAGAQFAAITANTPHVVFNRLKDVSPLPLISIVETCCKQAKKQGLKKLGLFGTRFTMDEHFYQDVFIKEGLEVFVPEEKDKTIIHEKLFSEIELGIFKEETKLLLMSIVERLMDKHKIDSLILGCTEFPLILTEPSYMGIPFLNTTQIHVDTIVDRCLQDV
ncbi:MAG: amino acid racemase [Bacteroidetes bacterium]|nr:amino acid racemase [Bacteroidota bacterium]